MKAGVVIRDITPSYPVHLGDYPEAADHYGLSKHDPLLATVFYLNNGSTELIWLSSDIIYLNNNDALVLRRRIAQEIGVPYENVIVSATGTKCGPQYDNWDRAHLKNMADPYVHWLMATYDTWVAACAEAKQKTFEASVGFGLFEAGADTPSTVMAIRDEASKAIRGLLANLSFDPMTLSSDLEAYSADAVCGLREALAKSYPKAAVAYIPSASADKPGKCAVSPVIHISSFDTNPVIKTASNFVIPTVNAEKIEAAAKAVSLVPEVIRAYGLPLELNAVRIGDGAIACLGATAVSHLNCAVCEASPAKFTMVSTRTCGNSFECLSGDDAPSSYFSRGALSFVEAELSRLVKQVF